MCVEHYKSTAGSSDFFGLNHYTSRYATSGSEELEPSLVWDSGSVASCDPSWKTAKSAWLKVVPWGFRALLNRIRTEYNNPPVFVFENGYSSDGALNDVDRIQYFHDYLEQMLKALHEDGCNIIGYTVWSIMDNFEWLGGYSGNILEKTLHSLYSQGTCFKAIGHKSSHPPARPAGSAVCFRTYCFVDVTHHDWHKLRCLQGHSTPPTPLPTSSLFCKLIQPLVSRG
ncbi:hypothetical protein J6590_032508 [Homalodisca vitripennis]|nr:hypothetical protein J6590_032508 [Homalodisca vitripennis]